MSKTPPRPTLTEIAERIDVHLRRLEADPEINKRRRYDKEKREWVEHPDGFSTYYYAGAHRSGPRVRVSYVSYQGSRTLTRNAAIEYLAWLDAGNVGTHDEQQHDEQPNEARAAQPEADAAGEDGAS